MFAQKYLWIKSSLWTCFHLYFVFPHSEINLFMQCAILQLFYALYEILYKNLYSYITVEARNRISLNSTEVWNFTIFKRSLSPTLHTQDLIILYLVYTLFSASFSSISFIFCTTIQSHLASLIRAFCGQFRFN